MQTVASTISEASGNSNYGGLANKDQVNSTWPENADAHVEEWCHCAPGGGSQERSMLSDNPANAGRTAHASSDELVKDRWQLPGTCLHGKSPHLPRSTQVNQSNGDSFTILAKHEHYWVNNDGYKVPKVHENIFVCFTCIFLNANTVSVLVKNLICTHSNTL